MPQADKANTLICKTAIIAIKGRSTNALSVRLEYQWHPSLGVLLVFDNVSPEYTACLSNWDSFPVSLQNGLKLEVKAHEVHFDKNISGSLLVQNSPVTIQQNTCALHSLHFNIVNFPSFIAGNNPCSHVEIQVGSWVLDLVAAPSTIDASAASHWPKENVVTHTGAIRRQDGGLFSVEDSLSVWKCFLRFLSFARQGRCGSVRIWGTSMDGACVWEQWGIPRTTRLSHSIPGWFDHRHGELLSQVFPKFWQQYNSDNWTTYLLALEWYLEAQSLDAPYSKIPLVQCTLERLASLLEATEGPAGKRIERSLRKIDIPLEIPKRYAALGKLAIDRKWNNGPRIFVKIRNGLIHDNEEKNPDLSGLTLWQASQLGLWYAELMLLYLFEHCGQYGNRTTQEWVGQVEVVPWAQNSL